MQDLTAQVFPDGPVEAMCPTSQAGGNRFSKRDAALSAPGSDSTAAAVMQAAQPGPFTSVTTNPANMSQVTDKSGKKLHGSASAGSHHGIGP
jgi:hypothetical protein